MMSAVASPGTQQHSHSSMMSQTHPSLAQMNVSPSNCALYIGELHNDVTEATLYQFIAKAGVNIISARVCRSTSTKKSLNYGYLNFQSKDDADKAMDELNYLPLMGKPVRMMYCQRDPSLRKSGMGNIIIKNLHPNIQPRVLLDIIKRIGNVLSLSLKQDAESNTQNAYIQFENPEHAATAVKALDRTNLSGVVIEVKKFIAQKEKFEKRDMKDETFVNCYVKNLPKESFQTEAQLNDYFSKVGEITSCKLVKDAAGSLTGAAFICYKSHESAVKACDEFDQSTVTDSEDEKPLVFTRFMRKNERFQILKEKFDGMKVKKHPNNNVYIKNLDSTVTDENLRQEFSQYGPVISAKVMTHASGQSRGFGFVSFENPKDAATAIEKKHNSYYYSKPLHCEWAQKKEERQVNLRNQFRISPQYFVSPHNMQYMMKQPAGTFFAHPNYMTMPSNYQMYPGASQNRNSKNYSYSYGNVHSNGNSSFVRQQNQYGQNGALNGQMADVNAGSKSDGPMFRMKPRHYPQQSGGPKTSQQVPQATPLSDHEKNNFGQEFMDMIRKSNNPHLLEWSKKIIGIFLDAGYEHCKRLVENPEVFRHSCDQLLQRLSEEPHH